MKAITVKVTRDHISEAIPGCEYRCPIACALMDMGYKGVQVFDRDGLLWKGMNQYQFLLFEPVTDFIKEFDSREEVHPIEFELYLHKVAA